jgi:lysophospholipase L1-like esterase
LAIRCQLVFRTALYADANSFGYANLVANQAGSPLVLPLIADPGIPPGAPRVNPLLQATDLAVPGQTVQQALNMRPVYNPLFPVAPDPVQSMTNVVLGFPGVFTGISRSQIDWANALAPDTILLWLGSNDVLGVFEQVQNTITAPAKFTQNLDQVLASLSKPGRRIVIANIPDVTLLPFMGPILSANPALIPVLKNTVLAYNAAIAALALKYGRPVVDIYSLVNNLAAHGILVNGKTLTTEHLGGLFSFDDIHPSDTGYAIIANEFIATINTAFTFGITPVDLAAVAASDPAVTFGPLCITSSTSTARFHSNDRSLIYGRGSVPPALQHRAAAARERSRGTATDLAATALTTQQPGS